MNKKYIFVQNYKTLPQCSYLIRKCIITKVIDGFVLCLALCSFVLVFFGSFCVAVASLGGEGLILVLFVRLFDLRFFGFVCFLFLLVSGKGCGL